MAFHIGTAFHNSLKNIEDIIFPQYCHYCDKNLVDNEIYICNDCLCNIPHTKMGNWTDMVTSNEHIDFAISAFWYDEILNDCIHKSKYNGYQKLLRNISDIAAGIIQEVISPIKIDLLIPVPLHHTRNRERGYNQAQIISDSLSKNLNIPSNPKILKRKSWTNSQTSMNTLERKENISNVFKLCKNPGQKIIAVIDDVLTTGATSNECCRVLKEGGADKVGVLTLATPMLRTNR